MTNVRIVKATEKHRRGISRLLRKTKIGMLGKEEPIRNLWVVENGEEVVACAGLDFHGPDVAIFTCLAVEKELRHKGIGSALIEHRTNIATERGARIVAFVTMYYWFNFYKKRGFRTCPRQDLPKDVKNYWMFIAKRYKKCAVMLKHL